MLIQHHILSCTTMNIRVCMCIKQHGTRAHPTHCSRLSARRSLSSRFRILSFFLLPATALFLRGRSCTSHKDRLRMASLLHTPGVVVLSPAYLGRLLALVLADVPPACRYSVDLRSGCDMLHCRAHCMF
jgi:hypothetical protein